MALIVQKYGGTCVATPQQICSVAEQVAKRCREGNQLVVVVSAMGATTDDLLRLAEQVTPQAPKREMDMLLSAGERISMALLSMALAEQGISSISFTGSQSGMITDLRHGGARIIDLRCDRIRSSLQEKQVVIVAGFQGVSSEKEVTTLGRGGSDTSAVALAAILQAKTCEIMTDVDGVFTADPEKVSQATFIPEISYYEMAELSAKGAQVLHPRSVTLAHQFRVPVVVKNGQKFSLGGTMISSDGQIEGPRVVAITSDPQKALLEVNLSRPGVVDALFSLVTEQDLEIQNVSFQGSLWAGWVTRKQQEIWKSELDRLITQEFITSYSLGDEWIPISVVGTGMDGDSSLFQKACDALARGGVKLKGGISSAHAITLAVSVHHGDDGVELLHQAFLGGPAK